MNMKKKLLAKLMSSCGIVFAVLGFFANESRAAAMINVPDPTDPAIAAFSLIWVSEADSWGNVFAVLLLTPRTSNSFKLIFSSTRMFFNSVR